MQDQMTHYMKLLATNQPWRLVLFKKDQRWGKDSRIRRLNNTVGIILGFYFLGVFIYLFKTAVIPLTMGAGWRRVDDVIAVGFYLLGVVPLFGIALLEIGLLARGWVEDKNIWLHAAFVGLFLGVAHVAMIFGMLNPHLLMNGSTTMRHRDGARGARRHTTQPDARLPASFSLTGRKLTPPGAGPILV